MSYVRWSEADVYLFGSVYGGIECCGCALDHYSLSFYAEADLLAHLYEHVAAGHYVPARLFEPDHFDPDDFARAEPDLPAPPAL